MIETDASNCMNLPVEALELEAPVRVHQMALRTDSGGPVSFAAASVACASLNF